MFCIRSISHHKFFNCLFCGFSNTFPLHIAVSIGRFLIHFHLPLYFQHIFLVMLFVCLSSLRVGFLSICVQFLYLRSKKTGPGVLRTRYWNIIGGYTVCTTHRNYDRSIWSSMQQSSESNAFFPSFQTINSWFIQHLNLAIEFDESIWLLFYYHRNSMTINSKINTNFRVWKHLRS